MKRKVTDWMARYLPLRHAYQMIPGLLLPGIILRVFPDDLCYRMVSLGLLLLACIWAVVICVKRPEEAKGVTAWNSVGGLLAGLILGLMELVSLGEALFLIVLSSVLLWLTVSLPRVEDS